MIVAEIGRVLRGVFLIVAFGFIALLAEPALSLEDTTVSGVSGKRVKLYSSETDRKAVERDQVAVWLTKPPRLLPPRLSSSVSLTTHVKQ